MKILNTALILISLCVISCAKKTVPGASSDGEGKPLIVKKVDATPVSADQQTSIPIDDKTIDADVAQITNDDGTVVKVYALIVSFYSIGSGINREAVRILDNFIFEFNDNKKEKLSVEKIPWGKEGEVDYCFSFEKVNDSERGMFIERVRNEIGNLKYVHVLENSPCKNNRK